VRPLAFAFFILLIGCSLQAAGKKRFVLYATFVTNTDVHLEDGAHWIMDKGDTFPVVMFKEQQTKVVLQLAGTSFMTDAVNVMIIQEKDITEKQLATYRENVQHYLDGRAEKWKAEHQVK
jgi:hypothetical protein